MSDLYLCGVGNAEGIRLALNVNRASARWTRIVLLDDDPKTHGARRLGLEVAGSFELLERADPERDRAVNLVTRTTLGRSKARARIAGFGVPLVSLVDPGVDLLGVELADEVTLYPMSSVGAEARVGRGAVVLVGGLVGHGVEVGEGSIIAPHAVVNARVRLGREVYVGSNASILPDLEIGEGATVAANTLVIENVPSGATALGVPAAILGSSSSAARDERPPEPQNPTPKTPSADIVELEARLAEIVGAVLGLDAVARTSNFFDLGGTSLKAIQLCERVERQLGTKLEIVELYRRPTLHALAVHLGGGDSPDDRLSEAQARARLRRQRTGR